MNRKIRLLTILLAISILALCGCDGQSGDEQNSSGDPVQQVSSSDAQTVSAVAGGDASYTEDDIELDLTKMSATMIYSEVYNILTEPDGYIGKVVRVNGLMRTLTDQTQTNTYYACYISDAAACCATGLEFVPADPKEVPAEGDPVVVTGVFSTYYEGTNRYCTLLDASVE